MEFHFDIVESNLGAMVIEADTYEEAVAQANDLYHAGSTIWANTELSIHLNRSYE